MPRLSMSRLSMTRRLVLSYLGIALFALVVLVYPLGVTFASRERSQLEFQVESDADFFAALVEDTLETGAPSNVQPEVAAYVQRVTGARVVIVDDQGISVLDSDHPGGAPRDFSTRTEFQTALSGQGSISDVRFSESLQSAFLYAAVPVTSGGEIHGAVRITYPTSKIDEKIRDVWIQLALLSAVVLVTVTAIAYALALSITSPVRAVRHGAEALAGGDLSQRVPDDAGPPELRSLAATFNRMAERLQRQVEAQRAFTADASHQLRSPLTALRLRLETIEGAAALGEADQARVDAALREVERLNKLVDSLLVLARAGGAAPTRVEVDLAQVLMERWEHWRPVADTRGVALDLDLGPEEPDLVVEAVPGTLDTVLDNLLDNAIGVTPAGSTVQLLGDRHNGEVTAHVVDGGPGMTAEQRARAFDRFWRAPGSGRTGSGLGLAIVADLMAANGGRAELAEGPEGAGLDASITLAAGGVFLTEP